jgi:hypothetical protein
LTEDPMPTHATALFGDRHAAHAAVEQLVQAGFSRDTISVVMSEQTHEREFAAIASDGAEGSGLRVARSGGVLAAILSGLVALPCSCGVPLRVAGPLVAELMREAAQGEFSAGLAAAGLGEPQVRFVDDGVHGGAIVVGVHASPERARLATQLLALSGGSLLEAA